MNKKISIGLCLSLIIVSITATFAVTMVVSKQIYNGIISNISQRSQTYESVDEISKIISNYFYGTVEDRSYLNSALVEGYVNGLGDPNSVYLDAEEYAEYTDTLEGGITGVGVETAYDYGSGSFVITHVYEGSPAAKAGLKAHDVVTAIDNTTVTRGNYSALSEKLYGSRLSSVKVEYERDGETKVVEPLLGFSIPSVVGNLSGNVGYVRITGFYKIPPPSSRRLSQSSVSRGRRALFSTSGIPLRAALIMRLRSLT